ncbi:histidine kinase [Oxynema sp. CENA135]|uniref:DICT sensory domain-containing protein n=1 Tax=Oxynema sp. CENA135 TaxID=984206 RepID=UPI00190C2174|nr:ATP-binding protein [Oxynema sp. CENA135]MBK4730483.1 histidine kinase [Oxynema sp. CENA135]
MNPSDPREVSLYDCALGAIAPPQPLQISPLTFKALVSATLDLLIEQKIAATLWVKLPSWCEWQTAIARYREWVDSREPIYLCQNEAIGDPPAQKLGDRPDSGAPGSEDPLVRWHHRHIQDQLNETSLIGDEGTILIPEKHLSPLCQIELPVGSALSREFFLIVLSPKLHVLILAYQHPSLAYSRLRDRESPPLDPQLPLLGIHCFDGETIQRVLDGLKHALTEMQCIPLSDRESDSSENESSSSDGQGVDSAQMACNALKEKWDKHFGQLVTPIPDLNLLGQLTSKQIQCQEELWRQECFNTISVQALQQENQELHQSLQLKNELLHNLGQELRTPLTNMKTALTLLNSRKLKVAQSQRYRLLLQESCDRQTSLIDGLLEWVQLESHVHPKREPLRLADWIPPIVSTYQPLAQEKGVMVAYTIPNGLPPVVCVGEWLKRIAIELLHNSIKFTPSGGEVWAIAKQQGDYIQLEVRDTGIGIPPQEVQKIFEPFYRGRQAIEEYPNSAGLGLTLVEQLLLHFGGSISVRAQVGKGSSFKVLLPVARNPGRSHGDNLGVSPSP